MPYISVESNRYLGEHSCRCYHYGVMTVVRECCVEDARNLKALVLKNALTTAHPAYCMFRDAWNSLTEAEMHLVGDIVSVGYAEGFRAIEA